MRINNLEGINKNFSLSNNVVENKKYVDPFEKFFDEAISLFDKTDVLQKEAEQKQIDYITGKNDDIVGITMAQTRASSAIQFTAQVTSKILNAYQEIMRIQI